MTFVADADFLPLEKLYDIQSRHWTAQRKRLAGSTFYRQHHPAAPVDLPTQLSDLVELPLTDKNLLRSDQAEHPPFGSYLNHPHESIVRLHRTSGTSGQAMNLALSSTDTALQAHVAGRSQSAAGLGPGDTVVHCLNYQLWICLLYTSPSPRD